MFKSTNPATGKTTYSFREMKKSQVERILSRATAAQKEWRAVPFQKRSRLMRRAADELLRSKTHYARLITLEMGKPIGKAESEIEKCARTCEYFAANAQRMLRPEPIPTEAKESYVRFDPIGVVFAIMPWNYPFWQVFRFAAPALMAGNAGILKHAGSVPQCSHAIEQVFTKTGFPKGLFASILVNSENAAQIIADDRIAAITLTGSERAGAEVGATAGRNIKKVVLELGGSDPFIVLEDADLMPTCAQAVNARNINTGQSCIAAKRFIVVKKIAKEFTELFVEYTKRLTIGDPMSPGTQIGPLAREDLRDELHRQVLQSVKKGAKLLTGGKKIKGPGYFYKPTALSNVKPGMPAYDEELFGPVASIIAVNNEKEAIRVANDTRFGLGASIWTKNKARAEQIAVQLDAGFVAINTSVKSDPRLPFGGIKKSGYGRELGEYGIKEFINIKTVVIN